MVDPFPPSAAADELLEQLLDSLLGDFRFWFERGEKLLALCPDLVMPPEQRQLLDQELSQARRELLAATRSVTLPLPAANQWAPLPARPERPHTRWPASPRRAVGCWP